MVWWRLVGTDCTWAVDFVGVDCVQMVILFVWDYMENMVEMGRGGACVPARVAQLPPECSVGPSF